MSSKDKDKEHDSKKRKEPTGGLSTRTGGAYIPPAKLRMMQKSIEDKSSAEYQRLAWEQLKKSINGLINKVNTSNITTIVRELIKQNLVRGRGLLCRSIMQAQSASQTFTNVYAALVSIINSKFPNIGELLLKRLIIQFRRSYKRNDKPTCLSAAKFIAHLVNQQVAHEVLALEIVTLLLEHPTEDSVEVAIAFLKECGCRLEEVSPRGSHAIFERLRHVLHEGHLEKRVQYMIEVMFQVRKDKFKDFPTLPEELDLVEEEDQFTHLLTLDEVTEGQDILNVFKVDQDFIENEDKYATLKKEILDESDDDGDGEGDEEDEDADEEEEEDAEGKDAILDKTETNLLALRRTIYLTIQSSLDFEECCHKILKLNLKEGQEVELCHMILDCCAQQRTYEKFFGLLAQRFCNLPMAKKYIEPFQQIFKDTYDTVHRLDTNKLRNVAKFFAHLLYTDAIGWNVIEHIKLTEDETTSSSRIFIKILMQELSEYMGLQKLNQRLQDPTLVQHFEGLFPRDHPKNTRFSINFFTSIGLGGLTDELREFLKKQPKPTAVIAPQRNESAEPDEDAESSSSSSSSSDDSSDSSDSSSSGSSSSSDSSSSSSSSDSSSDESDADARKKKKKKVSPKKQNKKASKSKKSVSPKRSPAKMLKRAGKDDKHAKKDSKKVQDKNRDRDRSPVDAIRESVDEKLRQLRYESDKRSRGEHSRNDERLAIRERPVSNERERRAVPEAFEGADRDRRSRRERSRSNDNVRNVYMRESDRQSRNEPGPSRGRGRSKSPIVERRDRRERSDDGRKIVERFEDVDRRMRRGKSRTPERRVNERFENVERRARRDRSESAERHKAIEMPKSSDRQSRRDRSRSDDRHKIRDRSGSNERRNVLEVSKSTEKHRERDRSRSGERRVVRDRPDGARIEWRTKQDLERRREREPSDSPEKRIRSVPSESTDGGRRRERSRSDERRNPLIDDRSLRREKPRNEEKRMGRDRPDSDEDNRRIIRERSGSAEMPRRRGRSRSNDDSANRRHRSGSNDRKKARNSSDNRKKRRAKSSSEEDVEVDTKTKSRRRSSSNESPKKSKRSKSGEKQKKRKRSNSDDRQKRRKRSESGERYRGNSPDQSEDQKPLVGYWDMADDVAREKNRESRRRRRERSVS